jgi:acetamidase/formamidase
MKKVVENAGKLGARMMIDGVDAAQTVSARLPALMTPTPTFGEMAERQRMVTEKVDAFSRGALEASFAWGEFWMKAAMGGVRSPADVMAGMIGIADAATKPASRRVRANARRLKQR